MLVDSPEEIAMFPIDQEKNLEGREEGRKGDKSRGGQRLAGQMAPSAISDPEADVTDWWVTRVVQLLASRPKTQV